MAAADNMGRIGTDAAHAVSQKGVRIAANILDRDLNAVHSWVKGLGDTYYGKQFITNLNQKICYNYSIENDPLSQRVFTDTPTTAGAWVDYGVPVLGLNSPDLDGFRGEDNRIQAFLRFDITDPNSNIIDPTEEENKQGLGQVENPEEVVTDLAPVLGNVATPNTSPDDYARIELNE
jgi:hypothetical protein